MADINARLKRALDGPAPQHKVAGRSEFEVTEGSGGQLHVKDADVSAELAEIKRTQADILARLDGTINTQVTGSNVEDENAVPTRTRGLDWYAAPFNSISIEPGNTYTFNNAGFLRYAKNFRDLTSYTDYYAGVQTGRSHDFTLLVRAKMMGTGGSLTTDDEGEGTGTTRIVPKTPITYHDMSIRIINNSEETQSYMIALGFWAV